MSAGSFCLVLHGHHPYVLHHGDWPHGEQWLFEAAAHTWLPLLAAIGGQAGGTGLSLDLSPVLLEQLSSHRFQRLFPRWLERRAALAQSDEAAFQAQGQAQLRGLAERWGQHFRGLAGAFAEIDGDIPQAFARHWRAGRLELMSSCATHAYLPLLGRDASLRAQVRAGLRTSERILGARPTGFWLPECAYRPAGPWQAPVLEREAQARAGVEQILAQEGVRWVVLADHLLSGTRSEGILSSQGYQKVGWDQASWDSQRRWRSPLEPHGVATLGQPSGVVAMPRHGQVSEQISQAKVGYHRDGRYLEFKRQLGPRGLRYWRVSSPKSALQDKQRYQAEQAQEAASSHAQHFIAVVKGALSAQPGGVVCAAFDAELFGHRWHEGPQFLSALWSGLSKDTELSTQTVSERLEQHPAQLVAWFPSGSWGQGGDRSAESASAHQAWIEAPLRWTWEVVQRAEARLAELLSVLPWVDDGEIQRALLAAAHQALLMQSSDWLAMVRSGSAVDYGLKRFAGHASVFDALCDLAWALHLGQEIDPALRATLALHQAQDGQAFADLDLHDWAQS